MLLLGSSVFSLFATRFLNQFLRISCFLSFDPPSSKTLGVITPTAGAGPELFGVAYQSALAFGCPTVPRSHGEAAGAASFLGLGRCTSGTYVSQNRQWKFLSEGCSSHRENKSCGKRQYSVLSTRYSVLSRGRFFWVLGTDNCQAILLGTEYWVLSTA
jgi:hypothetical protein